MTSSSWKFPNNPTIEGNLWPKIRFDIFFIDLKRNLTINLAFRLLFTLISCNNSCHFWFIFNDFFNISRIPEYIELCIFIIWNKEMARKIFPEILAVLENDIKFLESLKFYL